MRLQYLLTYDNTNKEELVWAAGLIDGEGYIGIHAYTNRKIRGTHYKTIISVCMTHKPTIERLYHIFRCGHLNYNMKTKLTNRKPLHQWICVELQAYSVIRAIYPYLFTKKEQAKYVLEYQNRKMSCSKLRFIPPAEREQRDFFYRLLKQLNKRGLN